MVKPETNNNLETESAQPIMPGEIIIGSLVGLDADNKPMVDFAENQTGQPLIALSTVEIHKKHIGRQVALLFANGNPKSPVIMGLIHNPLDVIIESHHQEAETNDQTEVALPESAEPRELKIDGKKILIEANDEIELKCGESSIILTKAGKIMIRGKYLLSRSSGVNRIMGGSVQVN